MHGWSSPDIDKQVRVSQQLDYTRDCMNSDRNTL